MSDTIKCEYFGCDRDATEEGSVYRCTECANELPNEITTLRERLEGEEKLTQDQSERADTALSQVDELRFQLATLREQVAEANKAIELHCGHINNKDGIDSIEETLDALKQISHRAHAPGFNPKCHICLNAQLATETARADELQKALHETHCALVATVDADQLSDETKKTTYDANLKEATRTPAREGEPGADHLCVKNYDEPYTTGTNQHIRVHRKEDCEGPCPIHNPSDHCMRDFPTHWRDDRGIMERICPHDVGHPDPDDRKVIAGDSIHGCCGCCCATRKVKSDTPR